MVNQPDRVLTGEDRELLTKLQSMLPNVTFRSGEAFSWSPGESTVTYCHNSREQASVWALFHEAGHALLGHKSYQDDIDLLQKEVAAWDKAKDLAQEHGTPIDDDHIEDCLDTYRDWLHQRSTCPHCGVVCLQVSSTSYQCHNCFASWSVSTSRLCRPYRLNKNQNKKPSQAIGTTFR